MITVGDMDLGQIFTKRVLADYMVSLFSLSPHSLVLDPCFGEGVFLDSIAENTDFQMHGFEIDGKLYTQYAGSNKPQSFFNADFLLCRMKTRYDGIIMNPPYIRHEKIDDLQGYGITKASLHNDLIFSKLPRTANLYMYFVVKAIDILKPNGELIVIFPESWMNSKSGMTFRHILTNHCSIEKRVHVSGNAFEKNALVEVVIIKLRKNASLFDCKPQYVSVDGNTIEARDVEQFQQTFDNRVPFSTYSTIRRGLATGCNEIFVNPKIKCEKGLLADIISSPKAIRGFSTNAATRDKLLIIQQETVLDKGLKQYLQRWEKTIIETDKPKTIAGKIKKGVPWYVLNNIDCEGIIFGYIVRKDMRFILNDSGTTVRDNFYIIMPGVDRFIMLALLNNYYVYAQLETNGRKYGGGMLKLQKYDVESLMLADLSIVSESDKSCLAELGCALAETGRISLIDEISAILSSYETENLYEIKEQYEYLRSKRLENSK